MVLTQQFLSFLLLVSVLFTQLTSTASTSPVLNHPSSSLLLEPSFSSSHGGGGGIPLPTQSRNDSTYYDAAVKAANWIVATAEPSPTGTGVYWSSSLVGQTSLETYNRTYDLYSGISGVIIYLCEIYTVTQNHSYLDTAKSAGTYLVSTVPLLIQQHTSTGLYHGGITGIAVALDTLYNYTNDSIYLTGYENCVKYIFAMNQQGNLNSYANLRWGTAGIGLFLLTQYQRNPTLYKAYLPLATQAGDYLISIGIPANGGLKWMSGFGNVEAPNYSEGTAGISYFLITLGNITQNNKYLSAGMEGGKYLLSIANYTDDRCLIYHDNSTLSLYYLANCHGPPGTGRFFLRLYHITGNSTWLQYAIAGANAVMTFSPWNQGPYKYNFYVDFHGQMTFWNNVGLCDGAGAVIIYFMTLYRLFKQENYLRFAIDVANDVLDRKTAVTTDQWQWIVTEWREDPSISTGPQVGYMQGAAGVGSTLLTLDSIVNDLPNPHIYLPDDFFNNDWN